jgi:hypothetical protein
MTGWFSHIDVKAVFLRHPIKMADERKVDMNYRNVYGGTQVFRTARTPGEIAAVLKSLRKENNFRHGLIGYVRFGRIFLWHSWLRPNLFFLFFSCLGRRCFYGTIEQAETGTGRGSLIKGTFGFTLGTTVWLWLFPALVSGVVFFICAAAEMFLPATIALTLLFLLCLSGIQGIKAKTNELSGICDPFIINFLRRL